MGTREIIFAAVLPAFVSLVVLVAVHLLIASREKRIGTPGPSVAWLLPGLLAGGSLLGAWAWQSRVELWAESVTHRFPAVALAALLAGLAGTLIRLRRSAVFTALPALVAGGFVAWAFLGALHPSLISEPGRWGWIAGVALLTGVQAWAIEVGARVLPGWKMPSVLWVAIGLIALGATGGFASAPLVVWPASAVCFALAGAGIIRRDVNLLRGVGPAIAVLIAGLATFSNWFGDRERWLMFALLMAAPLPLALAGLPVLRKKAILRLVVAAIPAVALPGIQAVIAVPALIRATEGSDEYDY
ncbi:MAG: hypothetical protein H6810_08310 [Phycisphaeraceae bacterium]|nr:MAG: hypothetical protein H6810_08310 [Phycisphaeraceae bacterium]